MCVWYMGLHLKTDWKPPLVKNIGKRTNYDLGIAVALAQCLFMSQIQSDGTYPSPKM